MRILAIATIAAALALSPPAEAGKGKGKGKGKAGAKAGKASGEEAEARAILEPFLKPGADLPGLSKQLRPSTADLAAIFEADLAGKADKIYGPAWDAGQLVLAPKPGQTALLLASATSEELKAGAPPAKEFPGGWAKVTGQLKPGLRFWRFKFVEPGKDLGMAFDGLVKVNGHFVIVPKPYRLLGG